MPESQNIEWKENWKDDYLKWVCGFANADGGTLVIGRKDNGEDVGIPNAQRLLEDIPNKVRDLLGMVVEVNLVSDAGKELIEIVVPPYPNPISYKGQYHYRSGSTKQELKGTALDAFLLRKQGRHWDGVPIPHVGADDLYNASFDAFKKRAIRAKRLSESDLGLSNSELLNKLHLVEGGLLKRSAVLLFHEEPARFITGASVKIGAFDVNGEIRVQDEVTGDMFSMIDLVMDLLTHKYLTAEISYDGIQRVETLPIPPSALREAVLNAFAHKDYSSGTPIQIRVYDNQLQIWNTGILGEGWTVETLKKTHASLPYNPDIAHTLYLTGLIESWGQGIEKMIKVCADHHLPEPVLYYDETGMRISFQWKGQVDLASLDLTENDLQILNLMVSQPTVTIPTLEERLDISRRTINRSITKLKELGVLSRSGSNKSGHWEVLTVINGTINGTIN